MLASSRDFDIALSGKTKGSLTYTFMYGTTKFSTNIEFFARYDHFLKERLKDPGSYIPVSSEGQLPRFIITGLIFKVHKLIKLSPNIKYVFYGDPVNNSKPYGNDLYFNLTARISFKTGLK